MEACQIYSLPELKIVKVLQFIQDTCIHVRIYSFGKDYDLVW